jgi:hypothetical protein
MENVIVTNENVIVTNENVIVTNETLEQLLVLETLKNTYIKTQKEKIEDLDNGLSLPNKSDKKKWRGTSIAAKTDLNEYIRNQEKILSRKAFMRMFDLETMKSPDGFIADEYLDEIKGLYLFLSRQGRLNVRYLKLPKCWLRIGIYGGILEELIVILRTAYQIGLGDHHMYTIENVMDFIRSITPKKDDDIRFLFLTMLNEKYPEINSKELTHLVTSAINFQGDSKRIGIYISSLLNNVPYVYAIQGIYGDIIYDNRVVQTLDPSNYDDDKGIVSLGLNFYNNSSNPIPLYAVHFTKETVALAIWNKEVIKSSRTREQPLGPGSICKFDRAIHALTCIVKDSNGNFLIRNDMAKIRDRMVHGINDTVSRTKYQAGLVIDLVKLTSTLPRGSVQINELGTLLVHDDIPSDCIIELLHTPTQLNVFWRISQPPINFAWWWPNRLRVGHIIFIILGIIIARFIHIHIE